MRKRFVWIATIVILIAVVFWYMIGSGPANPPPTKTPDTSVAETGVTVDKMIASFTLIGIDGKQTTVGQQGKVTIINFWATWCPPCREEMPELDDFAQKHDQMVAFYAINIQESSDKVGEFLKQGKYTMPVLLDKDGAVAKKFRINAIPTTIVVDKNGIIKYRKSGTVSSSELEGVIKGL